MKLVDRARSAANRTGLGSGDGRFAVGYFFLFSVYGITTPFLQVLVERLGYGKAEIGFYLGLFEAAGIGGQLLLGRVADGSGKYRPWLLLTAGLTAISVFPLALFPSPLVTFPAIVAMAFGVRGMVPVMDASVVAHINRSRTGGTGDAETGGGRRSNYGLIRSMGSIGYIVMLIVAQAAQVERGSALMISSWTAGAALVFIAVLSIVPESGGIARRGAGGSPSPSRPFDPRLILGLVVIALGRLAMAPINSFFTLYVDEVVKSDMAGLLWAISAVAEVPALILAKRLIERFGPMRVLALSTAAIALRLAIYIFAPTLAGALAGQLLHFFCYGLFLPSAIAFVSSHVPPERRVWGMSLLNAAAVGFPSFLGSAAGGLILAKGGYDALFGWAILPALLGLAIWAASRKFLDA